MPLGLFACAILWVHDGDTLRCRGVTESIRLYAMDAPEMPGACRHGRQCVDGDPYASRDNLRRLVAGRAVKCQQIDRDRYGRVIAQCWAGAQDLSCAQVSGGFAIERYGRLKCSRASWGRPQ